MGAPAASEGRPSRPGRRRSALVAAVLSGLGPGAGHAYAGCPARGAVLTGLSALTGAFFIACAPISYRAAQLSALAPMILLLALIIDSARQARRAAWPVALAPWQRPAAYAAVIVVTGFLAPSVMTWALARQAELAAAPDDSMDPAILQDDWVVVDKERDPSDLRRGDIVALRRPGRAPAFRRLVGLPGETVRVRRGVAEIEGAPLPAWLARPMFAESLTLGPVRLGSDQALALGDRRRDAEAPEAVVAVTSMYGRASWILLPADHDPLRIGSKP